ncbi:16S rRNA (adenine(1518)-N(6)/adenine(1519)-N(6))-dimethyltransferase RsmA [Leptospira gomenensis]|uniref:16S rRNA (Adenine(1518)-N(6)/adenine(1519)-N(6))-dimethyltransferase RsmA n=1 Tax=Leptospira gomenensis TaxID=2484974 RepID=A0A5F1YBM5_9LEPT|nr:16S rRNA (adenine(1518)-N(6)/adenine(1519)-N(6))-dimethyltransferase RsmA [Leptospira gomenensis]TGK34967.1 16S rRNA (adenine(1518)-N(6)/adenine(1519)-N(6))-dimethyltransferase RsmA [Leptospira gomenensis]TGK36763.1 16S rRNA (adenine(1518)-N(6)/adenine(1519)-N(6))-dimethyltransferase RsmA [Leptospira gomenensis]TGK48832.1 16S rRNA (adenine(1518)-N(6)/adenine(1519)-N(6))-dimethyltransferase RsmA [Leptospira gomenensis]TGK64598.1 16S rRNA (adenine(1518)-N(6)/adenine(1519)-N(6))-dimethyltransfe
MNSREYPFRKVSEIRKFLESKSSAPLKKWGQNFLIDPNAIRSILSGLNEKILSSVDRILEIGPGLGAISHGLLEFDKPVTLFEIDPVYAAWLREYLPEFEVREGDALDFLPEYRNENVYLFGNLPYYISSELTLSAVKNLKGLKGATFLVQKEFAKRISGEPSSIQFYLSSYGRWKLKKDVKAGSFYPRPNVDSSVLEYENSPFFPNEFGFLALECLCRIAFWGKRKKLTSSFRDAPLTSLPPAVTGSRFFSEEKFRGECFAALEQAGVDTDKRPEELKAARFHETALILSETIKKLLI